MSFKVTKDASNNKYYVSPGDLANSGKYIIECNSGEEANYIKDALIYGQLPNPLADSSKYGVPTTHINGTTKIYPTLLKYRVFDTDQKKVIATGLTFDQAGNKAISYCDENDFPQKNVIIKPEFDF